MTTGQHLIICTTRKPKKQNFFCGSLSYKLGNLYVIGEGTFEQQPDINTNAFYAYALYDIQIGAKFLHYITPAVRYESIDGDAITKIDKITFGTTFGFDKEKWLSHLRLNYEYIKGEGDNDPPDEFIVEYQMRFE